MLCVQPLQITQNEDTPPKTKWPGPNVAGQRYGLTLQGANLQLQRHRCKLAARPLEHCEVRKSARQFPSVNPNAINLSRVIYSHKNGDDSMMTWGWFIIGLNTLHLIHLGQSDQFL